MQQHVRYSTVHNQMMKGQDVTVWAAGTVVNGATVAPTPLNTVDADELSLALVITAKSGTTPTLDLLVETSPDNGTTWLTVASFAQQNNTGTTRKIFTGLGDKTRVTPTVGGTASPSFTLSLTGVAK